MRWAARVPYFNPMSPHAPIHKWKREFTMDRVHALGNDEGSINTLALSPTGSLLPGAYYRVPTPPRMSNYFCAANW
ncbi:hypothetical protein K0M31_010571, partial [Melipona bicolor]